MKVSSKETKIVVRDHIQFKSSAKGKLAMLCSRTCQNAESIRLPITGIPKMGTKA